MIIAYSQNKLRQRWPSCKVPVSGLEGSRLKTRFSWRSDVYVGLSHAKSDIVGQAQFRWCGEEAWKGECQVKSRPRHLNTCPFPELYPTVRIVLCQKLQHLQFVWVSLVHRKLRMILLWLIPICAERGRVPFAGLLAIADSTCVDVDSSLTFKICLYR
ncbi:hypothetical protein AVEN_139125-1 [Araneus ventricosus]|uniref:Uncharacterized protein n=1 Tax=Araneus ventricosus TaxID=182803 RepID=A0A4Y2L454_ARAVE|nr:hypothetical protein AVEN_139125-1 [Araneus ventricosus]